VNPFARMRMIPANPRRRSLAGLAVAALLLPFLLGSDACSILSTPVGDPEHGRLDPQITGIWVGGHRPSDFEAAIWIIEPYDARTWLLTSVDFKDAGPVGSPDSEPGAESSAERPLPALPLGPGKETPAAPLQPADVLRILRSLGQDRAHPEGISISKAWLATLGGRQFLVLEPKATPTAKGGIRPAIWIVYRVELLGGSLRLSLVDDLEGLSKVTSRARAEEIIAGHALDPNFYMELGAFYPVPREAYDRASAAIQRAGLEGPQ